jgi:hypothetical protein
MGKTPKVLEPGSCIILFRERTRDDSRGGLRYERLHVRLREIFALEKKLLSQDHGETP